MIWKLVYRPFVKQDLQKAIQYYKLISLTLIKKDFAKLGEINL